MAKLVFLPIEDQIQPTTYLLYDGALGNGGMLTVAEQTLQEIADESGEKVPAHLYGQEINSETYAICKADLLLKGEENADANIIGGPEHSTLANDAFKGRHSTSCSPTRPTGRAGRPTKKRWADAAASPIQGLSSSTPGTRNTPSSPAPATARWCS